MPPVSAEAALAWARAQGAVVRGLVHALSNRVGTVAAVGAMLDGAASGGVPPGSVDTASRILVGEGERLDALLAAFRLATTDPPGADAAPEPLDVAALLGEVAALAAAAGWDVEDVAHGALPPAVASRAGVVHALLALAPGRHLMLRADADGGHVLVRVAGAAGRGPALEAAQWLAGVPVEVAADGAAVLRLPALGARPV